MIKLEMHDGIATVTLNRPEKCNALDFAAFKQLDQLIRALRRNKSLRGVIIKGAGADFCSGLDLPSVMKKPRNILSLLFKWWPRQANLVQRVVVGWQTLNVPVFAIVQGRCYGGGCQLIAGADFKVATPDAEFAIMEARWGLCPDMGASHYLARQMRYDDLLWASTSATPFSAEQAHQIGLVSAVSDNPEAWVKERLAMLQTRSPDTLGAIKRLYQTAYKQRLGRTLARETFNQVRLLLKPNTRIAMENEKRDEKKPYQNPSRW